MDYGIVATYKTALLAGTIVGGTLSLLFAPQTGQETRKLLRDRVESVQRVTHGLARQTGEYGDDEAHARRLAALHMKTKKEEKMHNKILTMGFITGAIVGAVLGLLYAPKAGTETREFLKTKAEYTRDEARAVAGRAKDIALAEARKARAAAAAALRDAEHHEAEAREAEANESEAQQA